MQWINRYVGTFTIMMCLVLGLTLPSKLYLSIMVPWTIIVMVMIWRMNAPRRLHVHPEMLQLDGHAKYIVAETINSQKPVLAYVTDEGALRMWSIDMSVAAHPNLHAVHFLVCIAEPVLRDNRVPTDEELDRALSTSLRGKGSMDLDIDWPGMKESFRVLLESCDSLRPGIANPGQTRKQIIMSFVHELSCRLDEAVARAA